MTTYGPRSRILIALFDLVQAQAIIDIFALSETAGLNLYRTLAELEALDARGLVDRRRLRLTLPGFTVAAALDRRAKLEHLSVRGDTHVNNTDANHAHVRQARVYPLSPRSNREQPEGAEEQVLSRDLVA